MMEFLPKNLILNFNPDTLQSVRKEFNLDNPGRIEEALNILEDWVKKQNHFVKKDFSRHELETILIFSKGLVEGAKKHLDRYCTFKTIMPNYFVDCNIEKTFGNLKRFACFAHLPNMTSDNYRVYCSKILRDDFDSEIISQYLKYMIMLNEFLIRNDYCVGIELVFDFTNSNLVNFLTKLNVVELNDILTILMEAYGMKMKSMHLITSSKMIEVFASILKSILNKKLHQRIWIHKTVDSLYDHISRDILPEELGGKERSLKTLQHEYFKMVTSKEFQILLQKAHQAKTNESDRVKESRSESLSSTTSNKAKSLVSNLPS